MRETEPGLWMRRRPEGDRPGQGRMRGMAMIAWIMAVLTSPLPALEEEEEGSFYGEVPLLLEQEWVWGQSLSLVLSPD